MIQILKNVAKKVPFAKPAWVKFKHTKNSLGRKINVGVFHTARCGSTVIGNMLNSHNDIFWASELFSKMHERYGGILSEPYYVRTIITESMYSRKAKIYGFETKYLPYQHLREGWIDMDIQSYLDLLNRLKFSKYIIFRRKNYLRQFVSVLVGRKKQQWHTKDKKKEITRVKVDVDEFRISNHTSALIEQFRNMDKYFEQLTGLLPESDTLCLVYEDDILNDPRKAYHKICQFLDVQPGTPSVNIKRTNPFPLEEMITNFDEVRNYLNNTPYSWMLND